MGNQFSVTDFGQMQSSANKLREYAESYDNIAEQLKNCSQDVAGAWEGEDSEQYQQKLQEITEQLKKLGEQLKQTGDALQHQHDNYVQTQENNKAQAQKLAGAQ